MELFKSGSQKNMVYLYLGVRQKPKPTRTFYKDTGHTGPTVRVGTGCGKFVDWGDGDIK